jgi:hypothetical protein
MTTANEIAAGVEAKQFSIHSIDALTNGNFTVITSRTQFEVSHKTALTLSGWFNINIKY